MPNLGMSIIALPLEQGKLFLYLIIWIGIYGKVLPHVLQISKIISSIITGIGSGIGEQVKRSTMEPTLLIYSAGDWAQIILQRLILSEVGIVFRTTGKLLTHNLSPSNLVTKHLFHGKDVVVIRCRQTDMEQEPHFMEKPELSSLAVAMNIKLQI